MSTGTTTAATQSSDGEQLIYTFDKQRPDGSWQLTLTPLELLNRLARFIPAPRRHLHRYHGVFAPHAALRAQVAARAGQAIAASPSAPEDLAAVIRQCLGGLPQAVPPRPEPVTAASHQARSWDPRPAWCWRGLGRP